MGLDTFIDLTGVLPRIQRDAARRLHIPQPAPHPYSGPREIDLFSRPLWASAQGAESTGPVRLTDSPTLDARRDARRQLLEEMPL